jgi:uncharacterized protein
MRMVRGFFANGGMRAYLSQTIEALGAVDEIELICPMPEANDEAIAQCEERRDRMAVLSLPRGHESVDAAPSGFAAVYVPWVRAGGASVPPGGHVAGAWASGATELRGVDDPPTERAFSDAEVAALVGRRVNPLRGTRLWSSVTLDPDPEWKYVNVRRLLIFLERSIDQGTQWVVFEPNGEPLWAAVREAVSDFLLEQWRSGSLKGATPREAFFIRCDRTTMTRDDLDSGRLICLIGVAPIKPAEFVVFRIGQWTSDRSE